PHAYVIKQPTQRPGVSPAQRCGIARLPLETDFRRDLIFALLPVANRRQIDVPRIKQAIVTHASDETEPFPNSPMVVAIETYTLQVRRVFLVRSWFVEDGRE